MSNFYLAVAMGSGNDFAHLYEGRYVDRTGGYGGKLYGLRTLSGVKDEVDKFLSPYTSKDGMTDNK